ncbi:MAG TPA: hypothetical protein ENN19_13525 [Chloroflexi bacterium]|nr:hypothetical protein [Chloroflexota bacterium]
MELAIVAVVIVVAGAIVYMFDRHTKQKGALFTGTPSPMMRVLAGLFGLVFGGIFVAEWLFSDSVHFLFPILAIAALGYALGATSLLKALQGSEEDTGEESE